MTVLDNIFKNGKLPEIETKVGVSSNTLIDLAVALIVAAIIIIVMYKILKSV